MEGIDGSGKTTLLNELSKELATNIPDEQLLCLQEPTLLPSGRRIRKLLQTKSSVTPQEWLDLFVEDRKLNLQQNVKPAKKAGKIILQDRYFYSTAAYQGSNNGLSPQAILEYNRKKGFMEPDLLFYIKLEPELAYQRIQKRKAMLENFEQLERLSIIAKHYDFILPTNTIYLDARCSPQELCEKARQSIYSYLNKDMK